MGLGRLSSRSALVAPLALLVVLCLGAPQAGAASPPPQPQSQWTDLKPGSQGWFAKDAINAVALGHDWMRDYGPSSFHPTAAETREQFARALVRAFAPTVLPKVQLHFADV